MASSAAEMVRRAKAAPTGRAAAKEAKAAEAVKEREKVAEVLDLLQRVLTTVNLEKI